MEGVRLSEHTTPAQATATLRLAQDLGDRVPLIGRALNNDSVSVAQLRRSSPGYASSQRG